MPRPRLRQPSKVEVEYVSEKPDLAVDDPLLLGAFAAAPALETVDLRDVHTEAWLDDHRQGCIAPPLDHFIPPAIVVIVLHANFPANGDLGWKHIAACDIRWGRWICALSHPLQDCSACSVRSIIIIIFLQMIISDWFTIFGQSIFLDYLLHGW